MRLLLLGLAFYSYPCYADSTDTSNGAAASSGAPLLKARIEHNERVSAIPAELRAGNVFAGIEHQSAAASDNVWARIPEWAAGTWRSPGTDTQLFFQDYKTGEIDSEPVQERGRNTGQWELGFQRDKRGEIWTYLGPLNHDSTTADTDQVDTNQREEIITASATELVRRSSLTRILVRKSDRVILGSRPVEGITTEVPVEPGVKRVTQSIKIFDEDGEPFQRRDGVVLRYRVEPFRVIDFYQGKDLRALFRDYLMSHGMAQLVP